jgi:hypothetical protein
MNESHIAVLLSLMVAAGCVSAHRQAGVSPEDTSVVNPDEHGL